MDLKSIFQALQNDPSFEFLERDLSKPVLFRCATANHAEPSRPNQFVGWIAADWHKRLVGYDIESILSNDPTTGMNLREILAELNHSSRPKGYVSLSDIHYETGTPNSTPSASVSVDLFGEHYIALYPQRTLDHKPLVKQQHTDLVQATEQCMLSLDEEVALVFSGDSRLAYMSQEQIDAQDEIESEEFKSAPGM